MYNKKKQFGFERSDAVYNGVSVFLCGSLGIFIPIAIGTIYNSDTLGSFNQIFSIYIVLSQIAALGVHLSVFKHIAEYSDNSHLRSTILLSGILGATPIALGISLFLWWGRNLIGDLFYSSVVASGLVWASIALFFFALNKVFLAAMNGLSRFKEYAIYQAFRYLFMFSALIGCIMLQLPGHMIAVILPVAEGGVFILLFISLLPEIIHGFSSSLNCWVRKHVEFGLRACGGHILLDMNTRVDVLFLGFFFTDQLVGIYSMAAIFAEACYQLPLVLRTVYNPEVVRLLTQKRIDELKILVSHSRKFAWAGTTIMAVVCVIFMLYVLPLITGHSDYTDGIKYFLVIMAGMLIAAGYVPVGLMLVNAGFPGRQSFMIMILVLTNIIGNAILIPLVGSVGAALATAMTYVLSVLLLKIFVNQYLEFSL